MKCLSVSFRNAGLALREKLAFSPDEREHLRERLGKCVILCTCCRTELYLTGDISDALEILAEYAGSSTAQIVRIYEGEGALRHLFRVACGADSAILGEDEVLRQVKEAYSEAGELETELNTAFQAAVTCAKRIKTETALSKTPASAATVAANMAAHFKETVTVLMIGASGKIGSATLRNLLTHKNVRVIQTVHKHSGISGAECIDHSDRYKYLNEADCVISSTASPHFTVTADRAAEAITDNKKRLFIDLAVPHDIERAVGELDSTTLLDIDDINRLAEQGNELRRSAAEQAEDIISEELEEFLKKSAFREFLPQLGEIKERAGKLTLDELIYHLRSELDAAQFSAVLRAMERLGS